MSPTVLNNNQTRALWPPRFPPSSPAPATSTPAMGPSSSSWTPSSIDLRQKNLAEEQPGDIPWAKDSSTGAPPTSSYAGGGPAGGFPPDPLPPIHASPDPLRRRRSPHMPSPPSPYNHTREIHREDPTESATKSRATTAPHPRRHRPLPSPYRTPSPAPRTGRRPAQSPPSILLANVISMSPL